MPRGFVVIRVKEASGKNRAGDVVWDPTFTEGFIRAEMRSGDGSKIVENSTKKYVSDFKMTWNEEIRLEVRDLSKELRLMLCKDKRPGGRSTSCVAACGIFVADILKAVPINKYFELYKARATDQSEGGFIKVSIEYEDHSIRQRAGREAAPSTAQPRTFATDVSGDLDNLGPRGTGNVPGGRENQAPQLHDDVIAEEPESSSRGHPVLKAGLLLAAIGAGAAVYVLQANNKKGEDAKITKKDFSDKK